MLTLSVHKYFNQVLIFFSEEFQHTRVLDAISYTMTNKCSVVLVTGKPGTGASVLIDQLMKFKFPNHEYIKVRHKSFPTSKRVPNFIHIEETCLREFVRDDSPQQFIDMVSKCQPGTVAVMQVNISCPWYSKWG